VLDTDDYTIEPNPLTDSQTGVDYTHVLLVEEGDRWLLVIEKLQAGIWPNAIGLYLNWMLEEFGVPPTLLLQTGEGIVVSIEPEPGEAFIQRIESLDRVTKATLRIVRPNPSWADLEDELSQEAGDSDAIHADLTMTAKPRETLKKTTGIVGKIKTLFRTRNLGHAVIEGVRGNNRDKFSTEQMPKTASPQVQLDDKGQVIPADAFTRMEKMVANLKQIH
jgi:hypothetical protein